MNISRFFIDRPIFAGVLSLLIFIGSIYLEAVINPPKPGNQAGQNAAANPAAKPGAATAEVWIAPGTENLNNVLGVFADNKAGIVYVCSNLLGPPGPGPASGPPAAS